MAVGWWQGNPLTMLVGTAFIGTSVAYLKGPKLFGKREDGSLPLWSKVVHAPFIAAVLAGWWLRSRLGSEDGRNEVAPGIWLGRRPSAADIVEWKIQTIVDLTGEIPAHRATHYICLPTMDGVAPTLSQIDRGVEAISIGEKPILVHCLAGHSRSATVLAAWLIDSGAEPTLKAALDRIRSVRPAALPNTRQLDQLSKWLAQRSLRDQ